MEWFCNVCKLTNWLQITYANLVWAISYVFTSHETPKLPKQEAYKLGVHNTQIWSRNVDRA